MTGGAELLPPPQDANVQPAPTSNIALYVLYVIIFRSLKTASGISITAEILICAQTLILNVARLRHRQKRGFQLIDFAIRAHKKTRPAEWPDAFKFNHESRSSHQSKLVGASNRINGSFA